MYVYCVYPAILKIPKQLPNCLKIAEASVDLFIVNGILWEVHTYTMAKRGVRQLHQPQLSLPIAN
jgi:hypothetical protein